MSDLVGAHGDNEWRERELARMNPLDTIREAPRYVVVPYVGPKNPLFAIFDRECNQYLDSFRDPAEADLKAQVLNDPKVAAVVEVLDG